MRIRLDGDCQVYRPGDILSGEYRFESVTPGNVRAVETSVLWYTEGKGEEDLAVHEFWRLDAEEGAWIDVSRPGRFRTILPQSPLSYDGIIVKIRWCVRVRAFLYRGGELLAQCGFRLANAPAGELWGGNC